jgi:hypothetical protein
MTDRLDDSAPFNDDQGTRISDAPTGAGAEAAEGTQGEPKGRSHEHRSGYGGDGGEPKEPNDASDIPTSRR